MNYPFFAHIVIRKFVRPGWMEISRAPPVAPWRVLGSWTHAVVAAVPIVVLLQYHAVHEGVEHWYGVAGRRNRFACPPGHSGPSAARAGSDCRRVFRDVEWGNGRDDGR